MTGKLEGKVALVTGAGQGIGRGIALAMAKEGARLAITGRTKDKLDAVVAEIAAFGGKALALVCDMGDRTQVETAVHSLVEHYGQLDALINNAQSTSQQLIENTTLEEIALSYNSGTMGTFHAMQVCLPHLKVRGGTVINFGSNTAVSGDPTFGAYAMAKEAIRGLTRVAAKEWGRYNIRVNCICPTAMSPAAEAWAERNPERFKGVLASIPLGRMGDAEADIGRAVAMLCSDDMNYLTGATLMLGGGKTILG